jgi:hypothetical protein
MTVICCRWSVDSLRRLCELLQGQSVRVIAVQDDSEKLPQDLTGERSVSFFRWTRTVLISRMAAIADAAVYRSAVD